MNKSKQDKHKSHLFRQLKWKDIDQEYVRQLINLAREEDIEGSGLAEVPTMPGDATTLALDPQKKGCAKIVARSDIVICGLHLIPLILEAYGTVTFEGLIDDGTEVKSRTVIGTLAGDSAEILQAERVLLNFLQHLSGIATQTARYVKALGWSKTKLLDTRKTTPGYRVLEKYAVACGGGWNHRIGLFDRVMFKDNHLAISGHENITLEDAVDQSRKRNPNLAVEVEIDSLEQIEAVLLASPDIILLDNFTQAMLAEAVSLIGDHAYTEASGGVTLESLAELGKIGLDFISCGSLIHQSTWVDIAVDWE